MELAIDSGVISKPKELVITLAMLFIPLIWSGPQLLIGLVINMLLCISAKTSHPKRWLLMAALPSLAVIIHGVMFRSFTMYLVYLWPIITVANLVYMRIGTTRYRFWGAAVVKTGLLFSGAMLLYTFKLIPSILLTSMGPIQLVTALLGGMAASFL